MTEEKNYKVQICTGTLCHVMGGAELPGLEDHLPEEIKSKVMIKGMICANYCTETNQKPPFVLINGELMSEASIDKIIRYIQNCEKNDTFK